MRRIIPLLLVVATVACVAGLVAAQSGKSSGGTNWSMNATIIEACSCPMFCQCYFNAAPAGHGGHEGHAEDHYCRFNNAFKVNKGSYGATKLDGVKFWVAGDLGGDFSKGQMDWAVLTFDKSMTKEQRDAVAAILGHVYPVKWNSFTTAEGTVDTWTYNAQMAHATLDGGKGAEVKLMKNPTSNTADATVIKNLKYWGVPRNDGFVLMPNEVEAYRAGDKPFEFKGSNGFMITFDMSSKDVESQKSGMN